MLQRWLLIPAHLDGHAWCQIEFSHERHSPLLSPRGFQERMGHDLWSVESEKIEILIGTWNFYVRRGKMSKMRREKADLGGIENRYVSADTKRWIIDLTENYSNNVMLDYYFKLRQIFFLFSPLNQNFVPSRPGIASEYISIV